MNLWITEKQVIHEIHRLNSKKLFKIRSKERKRIGGIKTSSESETKWQNR